jgi:hypothetical protein
MWELVFKNKNRNYKFNSFLYIFLNIFEDNFPVQNEGVGRTKKATGFPKE